MLVKQKDAVKSLACELRVCVRVGTLVRYLVIVGDRSQWSHSPRLGFGRMDIGIVGSNPNESMYIWPCPSVLCSVCK